jgi:NAD(P)-dependent dehydrogenase (short-subunit alcohol dehydrogenase family)
MTQPWTSGDIPNQSGRTAVITGATGGLGYQTALALAGAGARVIVTGRNAAKGWAAVERIRAVYPQAQLVFEQLDVASLGSVAAFVAKQKTVGRPVDILVNNAGVMALPRRAFTADAFEKQIGTNYLGHFALTMQLLPLLMRGRKARVVSLSSIAHRTGMIDLADFQGRNYQPWKAYAQSKLAMLMFALELQRQSEANGWGITSVAAHPGWARTDLFDNGPNTGSPWSWQRCVTALAQPFFSQSAEAGALPILYAATAPQAEGGTMYGPADMSEMKGPPAPAKIWPQARDEAMAAALWELSESLCSVSAPGNAIAQAA